jgi:hypothetical protein
MSHLEKMQSYKSMKQFTSITTQKTISPPKKASHNIMSEPKQSNQNSLQKKLVDKDTILRKEVTPFASFNVMLEAN